MVSMGIRVADAGRALWGSAIVITPKQMPYFMPEDVIAGEVAAAARATRNPA